MVIQLFSRHVRRTPMVKSRIVVSFVVAVVVAIPLWAAQQRQSASPQSASAPDFSGVYRPINPFGPPAGGGAGGRAAAAAPAPAPAPGQPLPAAHPYCAAVGRSRGRNATRRS
jgi:hypothetical protein